MAIKVGFVGAGGMGQAHISNVSRMENVEVLSVCDSNLELATKFASPLGANVYEDFHDMFEAGGMDAVFVCTPPFARQDIEFVAAQKGIHLFVEKPLGLDMEMVRNKERAIAEAGIINSSGYCLRYLDTIQRVKSYLIGKQVDLVTGRRNETLYAPAWWKQLQLSGGQFVDQTTHQVDLIRYLVGEIDEVYAMFERRAITQSAPESTIYDVGTVSMKLQSGAIGSLTNTCLADYETRSELEFTGHKFQIFINKNGLSVRIVDDEQDIVMNSRHNFLFEQDRRFITGVALQDQSEILCSYSEAVKTLAVTLAANQSAIQSHVVRVAAAIV